ncbi:MAG: HAMP domain-containing histidine kinase [Deltaproteobacteria bacterium]|nr:HAMP domain-containing histidine kinase [Deltaproteobacteria bacterium]
MGFSTNRFFASRSWKLLRGAAFLFLVYSVGQLIGIADTALQLFGSIALKTSPEFAEYIDEIRFWGFFAGGALIFVGLAAIVELIRKTELTRQFRRLSRTITSFAEGNLEARAVVRGNAEIDKLGSAFNHMAEQIIMHIDLLKENDRLRCEQVSHIAHDLGGPVTAIQGFSETLLRKTEQVGKEEQQKYLRVIHLNARSLGKLVAELFDLSRLDAREIVPQIESFSIEALVKDVASRFKASFDEKGVFFDSAPCSSLPLVKADLALIERALSNLLENALRYTDSGGKISVSFKSGEQQVSVTVTDTGIGIPDEDQLHIFDSFYRVGKDRSRTSGGAGLGLTIVKKIVKANCGDVKLFSKLGEGTSVTIVLPSTGK